MVARLQSQALLADLEIDGAHRIWFAPSTSRAEDGPVDRPETRYATTADGVHIAYQVVGDGPPDFLYISPWVSHIEHRWQLPRYERYMRRIASFSRLILFDKRGNGLSDPVSTQLLPDLETRMDDARAVMDAVGSERAVVYGASESGAMACLFAATYPERTVALVIHASYPSGRWEPDAPWGWTDQQFDQEVRAIEQGWGTEDYVRAQIRAANDDPALAKWFAGFLRYGMSPGAAILDMHLERDTDVRSILPAIHVPAIILHRAEDDPEANRYFAEHIPGARLVQLPGNEHVPYLGDQDSVTLEIERFVRHVREEEASLDRVLATVLFTDIVGSTDLAARLGDRGWSDLLERHHRTVRSFLARYRGTEVDTAGDGFFATFDGPARAVKCATSIVEAVKPLGVEVRAGLHTGEVETMAGKAGGMSVVVGARVGSLAGPSEVLASRTVKDLTAGSGIVFEDTGEHELKGVPDRWHLYRVIS
jgi:class 3 adenylate cyclase